MAPSGARLKLEILNPNFWVLSANLVSLGMSWLNNLARRVVLSGSLKPQILDPSFWVLKVAVGDVARGGNKI